MHMGNSCKDENSKDRQNETYVSFWIKEKGEGSGSSKGEIGNLQVEKVGGNLATELRSNGAAENLVSGSGHGSSRLPPLPHKC